MKKIIFALLLLLIAGPVIAAESVTITITPKSNADGDCNGWADIKYTAVDCNVRAFALTISATGDAAGERIIDVAGYKTGESTSSSPGYGIFLDPNTGIDINDGVVDSYGSPVASAGTLGDSGHGLGTSKIILEMGSLYVGDVNKPPKSGTLCRVKVSKTCLLSATAETTYRGGVVKEDGVAITPAVTSTATNVAVYTFPTNHPKYAYWYTSNKFPRKQCFCYLRHCHGEADNTAQGNATTGFYYVGSNDLNLLSGAYKKLEPPKGSGITTAQMCADYSKDLQGNATTGFYYVGSADLNLLTGYYKKLEPPKGSGTPPDCQDAYGN